MINSLLLIIFFTYNIIIFSTNNIYFLGIILLINIITAIINKINLQKHLYFIYKNFLFIIFVITINIIFSNLISSLILGLKLFLCLDLTYIMSNILNNNKLSNGLYYLLSPLKLLKINIDEIVLIISITLTFIPILNDELRNIKYSLKIKGISFNLKSLLKPHIYLITFLNSLFNRLDEIEKALILKGY